MALLDADAAAVTSPRIRLERLSKSFGRYGFALRDVSLDLAADSFVSVIGASGSGKTTLLKMINRLTEPDSGAVQIDGERIDGIAPHELRRRIGYVFQQVGLFPHMSVAENIAITPRLLGWPEPQIAARLLDLVGLVGLPEEFPQPHARTAFRWAATARRRGSTRSRRGLRSCCWTSPSAPWIR